MTNIPISVRNASPSGTSPVSSDAGVVGDLVDQVDVVRRDAPVVVLERQPLDVLEDAAADVEDDAQFEASVDGSLDAQSDAVCDDE